MPPDELDEGRGESADDGDRSGSDSLTGAAPEESAASSTTDSGADTVAVKSGSRTPLEELQWRTQNAQKDLRNAQARMTQATQRESALERELAQLRLEVATIRATPASQPVAQVDGNEDDPLRRLGATEQMVREMRAVMSKLEQDNGLLREGVVAALQSDQQALQGASVARRRASIKNVLGNDVPDAVADYVQGLFESGDVEAFGDAIKLAAQHTFRSGGSEQDDAYNRQAAVGGAGAGSGRGGRKPPPVDTAALMTQYSTPQDRMGALIDANVARVLGQRRS